MTETEGQPERPSKKPKEIQDENLTISEGMINRIVNFFPFGSIRTTDRFTHIPIEDDSTRGVIATKLSACIKDDGQFAILYTDLDQLKAANDRVGRPFGDSYIKWGAARVFEELDKLNLSFNVEVAAIKPGYAADEIIVFLMYSSVEDLEKLKGLEQALKTPVELENPSFTLSLSHGLITSEEPKIKERLEKKEKAWLEEDNRRIAFEFLNDLIAEASTLTKTQKILKDPSRLDIEELQGKDILSIINTISKTLGGTRISGPLLERVLKLVAILSQTTGIRDNIGKKLLRLILNQRGVPIEEISRIESIEDIDRVFDRLFTGEANSKQ